VKLEGEWFDAQESVSKCLQVENEWPLRLERCEGPFIAPQGNLAVGVSEIRTYPTIVSGTQPGDRICSVPGT
jgi:hypothetical protein